MNIAEGFYSEGYLIVSADDFKRFQKECEDYGFEQAIELLKAYNTVSADYLISNKAKVLS